MATSRKRFCIANWKMHPASASEAKEIFNAIKRKVSRVRKTRVVVCPPDIFLGPIALSYGGSAISLGSQNVSQHEKVGSHTGEISPQIFIKSGVKYSIVGHSERRADGETDEIVSKKAAASLKAGLMTVICVGEKERSPSGTHFRFIESQLKCSLRGVSKANTQRLIIAYEPIWAIGKSAKNAMSPHEVHETVLFIRKVLVKMYGRKLALKLPILYGGSAEPGNDDELMAEGGIDGFLVGHASLEPDDFAAIVKAVEIAQ